MCLTGDHINAITLTNKLAMYVFFSPLPDHTTCKNVYKVEFHTHLMTNILVCIVNFAIKIQTTAHLNSWHVVVAAWFDWRSQTQVRKRVCIIVIWFVFILISLSEKYFVLWTFDIFFVFDWSSKIAIKRSAITLNHRT